MTNVVSPTDLSVVRALADQLPSGTSTVLDPSNPTHRAAIEAALKAAGRSPDRYPALYKALAGGAAPGADHLSLIDQGRDRSGRATAMTWQAAGENSLYAGGTVFALAGDSGELLALGHNSNVGDGFVPVSTDTATAKAAGKALKVLSVNHSVSASGQTRFTAVAGACALDAEGDEAGVTVNQPTQSPKTPPNLVIALGRDSVHPNPDADYTYTEPYNMQTPYLIVPFTGVADLPYDIVGTPGQPIPNAVLTSQIFFVQAGTTYNVYLDPTYTTQTRLNNGVTMLEEGTTLLQWEYPADGASYASTSSLVYGMQSLVNEQISYFLYTFQIPVTGGPVGTYSFAVCSTGTPNEPSYQCVNVPAIMFWWHCLAADTQVSLAGGGAGAIEGLDNTKRVKAGGGGDIAVEATSRGEHKAARGDTGPGAVCRLVTDGGHQLVGTGQHPVMTPDGLKAMSDLKAGDRVTTEDGTAGVVSCEAIDWDGMLCNLKLGDEADRAAGLKSDAVCTFVANGIVVGDHMAMKRQRRERMRNLDYMRAQLPGDMVTDYASAVEDIRY